MQRYVSSRGREVKLSAFEFGIRPGTILGLFELTAYCYRVARDLRGRQRRRQAAHRVRRRLRDHEHRQLLLPLPPQILGGCPLPYDLRGCRIAASYGPATNRPAACACPYHTRSGADKLQHCGCNAPHIVVVPQQYSIWHSRRILSCCFHRTWSAPEESSSHRACCTTRPCYRASGCWCWAVASHREAAHPL